MPFPPAKESHELPAVIGSVRPLTTGETDGGDLNQNNNNINIPIMHISPSHDTQDQSRQPLLHNTGGIGALGSTGSIGMTTGNNTNIRSTQSTATWLRWFSRRKRVPEPRTIPLATTVTPTANNLQIVQKYPPNIIRNQKYHVSTFLFVVLFNQFKYFFNLYFLLVCISQFIPLFRVTYLVTNVVPLSLVLAITITKEAYDDVQRWRRDSEANGQRYQRIKPGDPAIEYVPCADLKVGDVVVVGKDERVPADMILLRTSEKTGTVFIRTDQLDGETDWKLRTAVHTTQHLPDDSDLFRLRDPYITADRPHKDIHQFTGNFECITDGPTEPTTSTEPLSVENTMWMNTVVASGTAVGCVVYTGTDTRAVMNTSRPKTKDGLTDQEINRLSKWLCFILVLLSITMVALKGFQGLWWVYLIRFIVLFSTIIPLSLRVNLDMGKTVCSAQISGDAKMPGCIVRTSTIPEELGRIHYLLSDKTGTLTKNDMELKKIHLGTVSFGHDNVPELRQHIRVIVDKAKDNSQQAVGSSGQAPLRGRRDISARVFDVTMAMSLCHNVTPVQDADNPQLHTYQAASPDEIAIVKWTEAVGMALVERQDRELIKIDILGQQHSFQVLHLFPFTSETKRMGVVVRDCVSQDISFYLKGADVVMAKIVQANDWLEEECDNFAREGLRTLVIARKRLTQTQYDQFDEAYRMARISMQERAVKMLAVIQDHLEHDMELLGVTGVEDKLQDDVRLTLETLRNAGVKVWMLTGDKVETACCIALSSRLITRSQPIIQAQRINHYDLADSIITQLTSRPDAALVIDGASLQFMMDHYQQRFAAVTTTLPAVICCRCTPTQKADVARLLQRFTGKRVCCIGDGGNDVSMIQAANVGIGIVGKEGRQASLAADFSVTQFSHLSRLLLWHGRNSYKRTAKVSQFVIHRGFIIATMQAVFSALFYLSPIALYQGLIAIGYTTVYTMFPVFSLVLDLDITEEMAILYPELYKELLKGREVTFKTFFKWLMISTYQGASIMMLAMALFESHFIHIVMITFTALVVNEWAMVALETTRWHWLMAVATVASMTIYGLSMVVLRDDFDAGFAASWPFVWKVAVMTLTSFLPLLGFKIAKRFYAPPSYTKLR